jgi:hypothetical protein
MVVGGSSGHFGITTEQLPPPTPLAGPAVPGIALQPTSIPMYDIAAMYAIDGVTMRLQSGIRSADVTVNNYTASALILWDDSAAFTKPLIAPGATLSANTSVTGKLTVSANAAITGTTTMTGNATVSNKLTVSNVLAVTNAITLGGVDMPLTDISYYESTGSKANFDTVSQGIGTPTYLSGSSTVNLGTSGAGQITVTDAGIYTITASLNLYSDSARTSLKAATGRSFIDIADSTGAAYSRTSLPVGEDQTTGTHAGIKLSASSVLKFNIIQTSGGTAYYKVRIWLTRIG